MAKWLVWFEAVEVEADIEAEAILKAKIKLHDLGDRVEVEDIILDEPLNQEIDESEIIKLEEGVSSEDKV